MTLNRINRKRESGGKGPLASRPRLRLHFQLFLKPSRRNEAQIFYDSQTPRWIAFSYQPGFLVYSLSLPYQVESTRFKIVNKCRHTIWPGILTGANRTMLRPTGFALRSGKSRTLSVPKSWSGRVWARTLCSDDSSGKFSCATGDCVSGKVECAGAGATPPTTLVEFTLSGDQGMDFYDVSLVDGYNVPVLVVARGGVKGGCAATGAWWT
ncbi:unnamed protein product [Thlaspi arvense]|uniref:Thaumatin-like protein n=1 Tax=Thlaspi arvense TaxID=13288 RepID=A0AAU9RH31_THLAR|nr:unnamed protein product [Thlaspi arvense]